MTLSEVREIPFPFNVIQKGCEIIVWREANREQISENAAAIIAATFLSLHLDALRAVFLPSFISTGLHFCGCSQVYCLDQIVSQGIP